MISHEQATAILKRALEPGGVDRWGSLDRAVPGRDDAWVVVHSAIGSVHVLEACHVKAGIIRFTLPVTLEQLGSSRLTQSYVDDLLRGADDIEEMPPWVADDLIQIALFGKVFDQ